MSSARILLSIALVGCGSAPAHTTVASTPAAPTEQAASGTPTPTTYLANPVLNVYVEGPDPDAQELAAGVPRDFHARVVVSNTGNAPVAIRMAHIWFELARQSGEVVSCAHPPSPTPIEGPDNLDPGRAHTYEASFHCDAPARGEYDVRAYIMFGAALDESQTRERYYAGSYPLHVR